MPAHAYCAIDFGTSNSRHRALPVAGTSDRVALVEVEPGQRTMPTAVFYALEGLAPARKPAPSVRPRRVGGLRRGPGEGRLMRSMKSVLGSSLVEQSTEIGQGHAVRFLDVVMAASAPPPSLPSARPAAC